MTRTIDDIIGTTIRTLQQTYGEKTSEDSLRKSEAQISLRAARCTFPAVTYLMVYRRLCSLCCMSPVSVLSVCLSVCLSVLQVQLQCMRDGQFFTVCLLRELVPEIPSGRVAYLHMRAHSHT